MYAESEKVTGMKAAVVAGVEPRVLEDLLAILPDADARALA